MVVPLVLPWLGLPCAAPPSPLLGALSFITLALGVIVDGFLCLVGNLSEPPARVQHTSLLHHQHISPKIQEQEKQ